MRIRPQSPHRRLLLRPRLLLLRRRRQRRHPIPHAFLRLPSRPRVLHLHRKLRLRTDGSWLTAEVSFLRTAEQAVTSSSVYYRTSLQGSGQTTWRPPVCIACRPLSLGATPLIDRMNSQSESRLFSRRKRHIKKFNKKLRNLFIRKSFDYILILWLTDHTQINKQTH